MNWESAVAADDIALPPLQESSFGLFLGDSLESLQPVDFLGMQGIAAWPLANPVMTSLTLRSFDSIASPHLWVADGRLLLVFELISCQDGRRAIGVAESFDEGTTWKLLGASLGSHKVDALRKPQVLVHNGEVSTCLNPNILLLLCI